MKNKISMFLLSLITVFAFTACEEDQEIFEGPYRLTVGGPGAVIPETIAVYRLGDIDNPESYQWSLEGPAEFVGANTGDSVVVEFMSVGDVVLSVTNGSAFRDLSIAVEPVEEPSVAGSFSQQSTGVLRSGESDTVFFDFDFDVASTGSLGFVTDSTTFNEGDPFTSGSFTPIQQVEGDDNTYFTIYTAGEGNGTAEVELPNIISTTAFGSDTIESAFVQLPRVDNIDPIADISYDPSYASDSTEVMVTVTFSEPVTFGNVADSALLISFSGAGVATQTDTLMPTDNPAVYTYSYTVNGEGDGNVEVEIKNVEDMAGNELDLVRNENGLTIDNTNPEILVATAEDNGDYATIFIGSTETGTGMYLIMERGADAPTTNEEFMDAEGVASGSFGLNGGGLNSEIQVLGTGMYDVYYLVMDRAGNFSDITSSELDMD